MMTTEPGLKSWSDGSTPPQKWVAFYVRVTKEESVSRSVVSVTRTSAQPLPTARRSSQETGFGSGVPRLYKSRGPPLSRASTSQSSSSPVMIESRGAPPPGCPREPRSQATAPCQAATPPTRRSPRSRGSGFSRSRLRRHPSLRCSVQARRVDSAGGSAAA